VRTFLDDHANTLAGVAKSGARTRLDETIAGLAAHLDNQGKSNIAARKSTRSQQALRAVLLRDHMSVIARIARATMPNTPEIAALRMPKQSVSVARLAAAAHEMANGAEPLAAVFVGEGLPSDFVTQLKAAADALLSARDDLGNSTGRRTGATAGLKSGLTAARKVVGVLDAMVRTALKGQPGLIADWKSISRVKKVTVPGSAAPAPAAEGVGTAA
jgi:hypothetical protein